jgi:hypothetical protein
MRRGRAPATLLSMLVCACARVLPAPTPPPAKLVPPVGPDPKPSVPACADSSADGGASWVAERRWHERTTATASCQIAPVDTSSELVVNATVVARAANEVTKLLVRVVSDREAATGVSAAPSLSGRSYWVQPAPSGLDVRDASGAPLPGDQDARRIRAVASVHVSWPGTTVAARLPKAGSEVAALADAVRHVVDPFLHGEPANEATASVRFVGPRDLGRDGTLVFDVKLHARTSDAGMCHRWTMDGELAGELLLRTADGAFMGLHLHGPRRDTEALCLDLVAKGSRAEPRTCNEGEVTLEVLQNCAVSP